MKKIKDIRGVIVINERLLRESLKRIYPMVNDSESVKFLSKIHETDVYKAGDTLVWSSGIFAFTSSIF